MDEGRIKEFQKIFLEASAGFPQIRLAYLFGSRAVGLEGPSSDWDLAVLADRGAAKSDFHFRLGSCLAKRLDGNRVDVVLLIRAPVELAYAIISTGEILYERDVQTRVDYESRVMGLYFDYLPVLRAQRRDILKGGDYEARVQRYRKALGRTFRTLGQIRTVSE